jgi:hypothetical protein
MCVFHRWMALQSERVALAHMLRIRASSAPARDRTRTQGTHAYPFTYEDCASIYIYIYSYMTSALAIYPGGRAHARTCQMATAASSARAIARKGAWEAVPPHASPYTHLSHEYTYTHVCVCVKCIPIYTHTYSYTYKHTYDPTFVRAAIPTHVDTRACACPHVWTHARASKTRRARPACGGAPPGPERAAHT